MAQGLRNPVRLYILRFLIRIQPRGHEQGETVNLVLETWLDHEDYKPENNESGRWVIPVTYDTVAPFSQ